MEQPPPYSPEGGQAPGYPPQSAPYPPQQPAGYPPQKDYGGGYPPQNRGYAPQNQGYPSHGYVQQPVGFSSQSSNNTTVVVQQNQPQVVAAVIPVLNDQMGLSIFACLCCFWPIGIFAIMKSSEARNRYVAGDYAGAVASAQSARNLAYAAIICGLIIIPLIIVLRVVVFATTYDQQ